MDVSGVIAVWLASSVLGLAISAYGCIEAAKDLRAVQGLKNGRRLVAQQRLFAQGIRTFAFFLWTAIGIFVINADVKVTFTVFALVVTNVAYAVLAASDLFVGWRLRTPPTHKD